MFPFLSSFHIPSPFIIFFVSSVCPIFFSLLNLLLNFLVSLHFLSNPFDPPFFPYSFLRLFTSFPLFSSPPVFPSFPLFLSLLAIPSPFPLLLLSLLLPLFFSFPLFSQSFLHLPIFSLFPPLLSSSFPLSPFPFSFPLFPPSLLLLPFLFSPFPPLFPSSPVHPKPPIRGLTGVGVSIFPLYESSIRRFPDDTHLRNSRRLLAFGYVSVMVLLLL